MKAFTDKVVLVTGGTSGIGRATALAFAQGGASVVIVGRRSSEGAQSVALPGISPYAASKHAVMGLTRLAALDYAKQGIRINAVNPGPIATELMARSVDQMGITFDDIGAMVPIGRIGQAA